MSGALATNGHPYNTCRMASYTPRTGSRGMFLTLVVACATVACGDEDAGTSSLDATAAANDTDAGAAEDAGAEVQDAAEMGPVDSGSIDAGPADSGVTALTWEGAVQPLFTTYCVECHAAGNQLRDYSTYSDAFRDRDEIRCGVAPPPRPPGCSGFPPPAQFPVGTGPKPSADERQQFVDWVDNGALER